jgi:hypothetical protein
MGFSYWGCCNQHQSEDGRRSFEFISLCIQDVFFTEGHENADLGADPQRAAIELFLLVFSVRPSCRHADLHCIK